MEKYIIKASGKQELFDITKFRRSLRRAGAKDDIVDELAREIEHRDELKTTHDIYKFALGHLKDKVPTVAGRYNIKNALLQLGPAGYPFEQFVAKLFDAQGFNTETNPILSGKCVEHEVDILIDQNNEHGFVECKFHNNPGIKSNVKVTLYIQARFEDIKKQWLATEQSSKKDPEIHYAWIVTNTKFTSQAIAYGECVNLKMLSWNYPHQEHLAHVIDKYGIHPITALTCLTTREKKFFIQNGFVLCKDVRSYEHLFTQLRLTKKKIERIIEESEGICA